MDFTINPDLVYVCTRDEFDDFKDKIPKLVGLDLSHAIDPQLIYFAEDLGGCLSNKDENYQPLSIAVDTFLRGWQVTKSTHLHSHIVWSTNAILNVPVFMQRAKPFAELEKQPHKNKALVIGNGPSIMQNIDWLQEEWKTSTTIACWHVLPTLLMSGLIPDYVAHIDGKAPVMDNSAGLTLPDTTALIGTTIAVTQFYNAFPNCPIFLQCDENRHIAQAVAKVLDFPISQPCYGTVVYLQCMAAVELGCEEVTLIGVDLKSTNKRAEEAYKIYVGNLAHFARYYCPDDVRLYNASNGRSIEGFKDINGSNIIASCSAGKQKRRSRPYGNRFLKR